MPSFAQIDGEPWWQFAPVDAGIRQDRRKRLAGELAGLIAEQPRRRRVRRSDCAVRDHQQRLAHGVDHALHVGTRHGRRLQLGCHVVERHGELAQLIAACSRHPVRELAFGQPLARCNHRAQRRLHCAADRERREDTEYQREQQTARDQKIGVMRGARRAIHRGLELGSRSRLHAGLEHVVELTAHGVQTRCAFVERGLRGGDGRGLLAAAGIPAIDQLCPVALDGTIGDLPILRQRRSENAIVHLDALVQIVRAQIGCAQSAQHRLGQRLHGVELLQGRRRAWRKHRLGELLHQTNRLPLMRVIAGDPIGLRVGETDHFVGLLSIARSCIGELRCNHPALRFGREPFIVSETALELGLRRLDSLALRRFGVLQIAVDRARGPVQIDIHFVRGAGSRIAVAHQM